MPKEKELPQHRAHILWSRESFASFPEPNCGQNLCQSEGTLSSSSWGFDDYEIKSVKKITSSLNAIESILYDEENGHSMSQELHSECQKWATAFPHFRVRGKQMKTVCGDISASHPLANNNSAKSNFQSGPCNLQYDEEIIAQDHTSDGILPSFKGPSDCVEGVQCISYSFTPAYIKQRVIEQVAFQLWQNVVFSMKRSRQLDSYGTKQEERLPPILNASSSFQRQKAKVQSPLSFEYQKLEGILTVSPKVLLPRNDRKVVIGIQQSPVATKPKSPVLHSSQCYMTGGGYPLHAKLSQVRKAIGQSLDVEPLLLRSAEEDGSEGSGLQGTRIEPLGKDSKHKLYPFHSLAIMKPPSFLPPIEDSEHVPSCTLQDLSRPTTYECRVKSGRSVNQSSIYARHLNRLSSRPSTSRMTLCMKNSDVKVVDTFTCNGAHRKEKPAYGHNLVNLLPIVTSKELTQCIFNLQYHTLHIHRAF